jgi:hypothetical protein
VASLDLGNLMRSLLVSDPLGPELRAMFSPVESADDDASLPPDHPPGAEAHCPREATAEVRVGASFVKRIKLDYGPRSPDPESRLVGQRAEARAFVDSLKAGKIKLDRAG